MKIGIIGAGISGLTAAHYLQRDHQVVLFEAERRPGGHTHTVDVKEGDRPIPVDTGFIVFNTETYPGFVKLLGELGVAWAPSEMSFSVRSERRDFEYSSNGLRGLFAQPSRLASPRFWQMLLDLRRFYAEGRELLLDEAEIPLAEWLKARRYSTAFIDDHLMPMVRAVWSANREVAERFPARFLARFFDNHGFLQLRDPPRWLSIPGGSRSYVRALLAGFQGELRLGAAARAIRRTERGATIAFDGAPAEHFDHLILACHSDQALGLLSDPSEAERTILSAIPYQNNEVVLHTDERMMPTRKAAWSSWNVHLDDDQADGACLTYWMNRLQPLGAERNYLVTLNRTAKIRPESILRVDNFAHPIFGVRSFAAQARHRELIDHRSTSYCGAYWGNGFHEDGVQSALRVVERIEAKRRQEVAA